MKLSIPRNLAQFAALLDEHMWLRMIVCFLPGLVVGKLAGGLPPGSALSALSTVLLVLGVAVFALWTRVRARLASSDEMDDDEPFVDELIVSEGPEILSRLKELRDLCGEADRESDNLVAMEIAVKPDLGFAQALDNAIARKKLSA